MLDIVLSANVDFVVCTSQLFFFLFLSFLLPYKTRYVEKYIISGKESIQIYFFFLLPSREISSSILPRNKCSNSHIGMHNVAKNKGI